MSGFRNFDAWLTTNRAAEEADRRTDAWERYCEEEDLDTGIADPQHPEHSIFQEWESSFNEYE